MMHMWFWLDTNLGSFLFNDYKVTGTAAFIATCLGLLALTIIYEAMKPLQFQLHQMTRAYMITNASNNTENSSLLYHLVPKLYLTRSDWRKVCYWMLEVTHYSTHTALGYILMLAAMTFNAYICMALIIGSTIGYWIFSPAVLELNITVLRKKYKPNHCDPTCADVIIGRERRQSTVSIIAEQIVSEVNAEIHTAADA